MKKTMRVRTLSVILCAVLIAAMALFTCGCNDKKSGEQPENTASETNVQNGVNDSEVTPAEAEENETVKALGVGKTKFNFSVIGLDGIEKKYEISTDKTTVGDALSELGLIEGEQGEFGLYVKTVDGITVDFDKDGKYWAFYIDGEYGMTGVDKTAIEDGKTYAFKVEK